MSEVLQENWYYIVVPYAAIMAYLAYSLLFSNRGKIKVRVKTPTKEWVKWCKPQPDGETIVVEKAKTKKGGWSFKFTNKSLIPFSHRGRSFFAIDIFYNSPIAIEYDYAEDIVTKPRLTKDQVKEFASWEALKARYARMQQQKTSMLGILTVVLLVVVIILELRSSGVIRF
jgi:hypothetical protein